MNVNTTLASFKQKHKNKVNQIIFHKADCKNNKIIEGNPDQIKTANDIWKFSKNMWSQDPTWYLVETSNKQ